MCGWSGARRGGRQGQGQVPLGLEDCWEPERSVQGRCGAVGNGRAKEQGWETWEGDSSIDGSGASAPEDTARNQAAPGPESLSSWGSCSAWRNRS